MLTLQTPRIAKINAVEPENDIKAARERSWTDIEQDWCLSRVTCLKKLFKREGRSQQHSTEQDWTILNKIEQDWTRMKKSK